MKNKSTRILSYIIWNLVVIVSVICGTFYEIKGFENVAVVIITAYSILSLFASLGIATDDELKTKILENTISPVWLDIIIDTAVVVIMLYFGWFWTGALYFIATTFMSSSRLSNEKQNAKS